MIQWFPMATVTRIETDYKVGQDNVVMKLGPFGLDFHNRVFAISGIGVILFVLITLIFQA